MTPRTRRLIGVALTVTVVLVAGRAVTDFLSVRWWAGAISDVALRTSRRWQWLGVGLDAGAIIIASLRFATQALLVARAIASVQVQRQVGDLSVREMVPTRFLLTGAIATGILLGLVTGTGAAAWREPFALAWQGVHYGVNDPILGHDLGVYVAAVPVWDLAHGFANLLLILGLGFVAMLYLGAGALRLKPKRSTIHPYAQRHLGGLLTLAALAISWGYLLKPYHLVIDSAGLLGSAAINTRIVAAYAMAGAALAVAVMTARWAVQARHSLFLAGWTVLAVAVLGERVIVPAFVAESPRTDLDEAAERQIVSLAYGVPLAIRTAVPGTSSNSGEHDIWDPGLLANIAAGQGERLLNAAPTQGASGLPWRVVVASSNDSNWVEIRTIIGDSVSPRGLPIVAADPILVAGAVSIPGEEGWRPTPGGVVLGSVLRRGTLAWALQAPGLLTTPATSVDWQLDPTARLTALMPALAWQLVGALGVNGAEEWLLLGLATIDRVPYGVPTVMLGQIVEGAVPAVIAAVSFRTGVVRAWVDPAADSLGVAWARVYRPLVGAAAGMPAEICAALPYSPSRFLAQATVLTALDGDSIGPRAPVILGHQLGKPVIATPMADSGTSRPRSLLMGEREAGRARLMVQHGAQAGLSAAELTAAWRAMPGLQHIRDSLHAAGDSLIAGPVHRLITEPGLESWQVFASAGRSGPARLLWIGTNVGVLVSGGSQPHLAWATSDTSSTAVDRPDAAIRLETVRAWIERGDSALARRDMTAFGRAWEALRGLMLTGSHQ